MVKFPRLRFLASSATGHAMTDWVMLNKVSAPGPSGVKDAKPAPSLALLPIMSGYYTTEC